MAEDNYYIPTQAETVELQEAIANAQGYTPRQLQLSERLSERTLNMIVAAAKAVTKKRKQEKINAVTLKNQGDMWAATLAMPAFKPFRDQLLHYDPLGELSTGTSWPCGRRRSPTRT